MDQAIPKVMWVRWDGLQTHKPTTQQVQPVQSVSTANDINYDSDSTVAYDLGEVMNMEYENNSNHIHNIPASIDDPDEQLFTNIPCVQPRSQSNPN